MDERPPEHGLPESARCPILVGWKEFVALPEWGVKRMKAKIDTGARTSALDVHGYRLVRNEDGTLFAELRLALGRKRVRERLVQVPVLRLVQVKSSTGVREERPLIETTIRLGSVVKRIHLTVTDRCLMRFRMILGRKALEGDFHVDVARKYCCASGRRKKTK